MASLQDLAADLEHAVTWRNVASDNLRKCVRDVEAAAQRLHDAVDSAVLDRATTAIRAPTADANPHPAVLAQDRLAAALKNVRAREAAALDQAAWNRQAAGFDAVAELAEAVAKAAPATTASLVPVPAFEATCACGKYCNLPPGGILDSTDREHSVEHCGSLPDPRATTAIPALSADELQQLRAAEAEDNAADAITTEDIDQWEPEDDDPGGSCHDCGEDTCVCLVEGQPGPEPIESWSDPEPAGEMSAEQLDAAPVIAPLMVAPSPPTGKGLPLPQRPSTWHERAVDQVVEQTAAATARHVSVLPDAAPDPGATIKSMLLWAVRHAQKSAGPKAVPAALLVELVVKHKPSLNRMSVRVELPKLAKAGLLDRPGIGFYALPGYAPERDRKEEPDKAGEKYSKTA